MKYTQLFTKTSKNNISDTDSLNAKLLTQAGFISQEISGVYNYLPLGLKVLRKIENIIRQEMDKIGGQEILMPSLSSLDNWAKSKRDTMDILFHLDNLILNPTHEELVTPLVKKFVFSYKDLPTAVYQIQTKFRNEPRAKSGLLRGREFVMKDLYSFHTNQEDLDSYYQKVQTAYTKIFKRLEIDNLTYLTYATGGTFSKYSHEYQTLCPTGEDEIHICPKCKVAVNKEIIAEQAVCPECGGQLEQKQAIEVANIFKLGTKFTDVFSFKYLNKDNKLQPILMACYGMGPSRIMGSLVEVFGDDKGLLWPQEVSPFTLHLVGLDNQADDIYNTLIQEGVDVLYDDRSVSAGIKFADADLIGIPTRIVVSKKSLEAGGLEIKNRKQEESKIISLDDVILKYGQKRT
jgi:prolyl-tRNA synthetase